MFFAKTYLFRPESRKPLANGFLSIFKRVICRVKKIKKHIRSYYKCQVRLLKIKMMEELQVIPKFKCQNILLGFSLIPHVFYYLSSKLEENFRNHPDMYLL